MKSDVIAVIGFAIIMVCLLSTLMWYNNLPTVKFSNTTGKCVSVEQVKTNYTCDNLPSKYHKVIVK